MFFNLFTSAQTTGQPVKQVNKLHLWSAIGPQLSITDYHDFMLGPNVNLNLMKNKFLIVVDFHAAISTQMIVYPHKEYIVTTIAGMSLMSGYRIKINNKSDFQIAAGIGYGALDYRGKSYYYAGPGGSFGSGTYSYDKENFSYVGFPFKVSYLLTHKIVGLEIYASANFHKHSELAIGANFLLGKIK